MGSYRVGGLAIALGIGSAVIAGHGVASADTTGESSSDSSSSNSSASTDKPTDTSTSTPTESTAPSESASQTTPLTPGVDGKDSDATTTTPSKDDESPTPKKRSNKSRASGASTESAADGPSLDTSPSRASVVVRTETASKDATLREPAVAAVVSQAPAIDAPVVTIETVRPPVQPEAIPPSQADTGTVTLSETASTGLNPFAVDGPVGPMASPMMWTLAAAARREISVETTALVPPADITTTSLADETPLAALEAPKVAAIEQIAPFAFLQQVPIVGPLVFTPIVAIIHQIPVVGDFLHQFVGYPVEFGLRAGAPKPRDFKVISFDGTEIYVHFIPARGLTSTTKAPTVLNGPGLGLPGATTLNGTPFDAFAVDNFGMLSVGTLRDAGYNVVTWDPRGEWNSGGQLELNSAEYEARDMSAIISWLADRPEVLLDAPGDPRIGMVGVSYGGGIQLVTAANDHRVDAIVPAITYHSFDSSLYKNGAFKNSWATLLTAVLVATGARTNPRVLPAAVYGALTGEMLEADLELLKSRNPDITKIIAPTLLIHGTVDTVFSLQEADDTAKILIANGVPTKVVWFCGGHGVCANNFLDLSDGVLIQRRTLEWLDRYVKQDVTTQTGPQFEWVDQRGQWHASDTYPVSPGTPLVASGSDRTLALVPYIGGSGIPFVPIALPAPYAVNLTVAATEQTYLVGAPKLSLTYSGAGTTSHVYAQLVDNSTGLVLGSIATPIPVTLDGESHEITIDLEPVAHTLRAGASVTLQLVGSAGLYGKINPEFGQLTVSSIHLSLPTANPAAVLPPAA